MSLDAERERSVEGKPGVVRPGFELDHVRLGAWLEDHVEGFAGPFTVSLFEGGQSNPTYRLRTLARNYVLRRKPFGALHRSAHAVDREYRVMAALGKVGFPVPQVFGLCEDDAVIGSSFYVMACVEGRGFWRADLPGLAPDERGACLDAMNAALARLHKVNFVTIGLGEYGRPGNYVERQLARFSAQYFAETRIGRSRGLELLLEWLPANIPPSPGHSIVHGDFKMDNMLFEPRAPRIAAVLDWELSTLGDPLADFAYHAMMYRMPQGLGPSLMGLDLAALGLPTEKDYVAAYCRRTGRQAIEQLDFYVAFNMFRLAAILRGILGRAARGNASSARAADVAARVEPLADAAWQQVLRASA